MTSPSTSGNFFEGNKLLGALPEEETERLRPYLDKVTLRHKDVLYEPDAPIEYVYFPIDCVTSTLAVMEDGQAIEAATIGNEGMTGLPAFLGAVSAPLRSICQVPGDAIRMETGALRSEVGPNSRLHELLQRYTEAMFIFIAQSSACNRLHSAEQRCSRWLLQTHDRVVGDEFPLTQEFLSQMLGLRRATVNEVAGELQRSGLISYGRGAIRVLDRPGLEAASCECYGMIKKEFDRLLG